MSAGPSAVHLQHHKHGQRECAGCGRGRGGLSGSGLEPGLEVLDRVGEVLPLAGDVSLDHLRIAEPLPVVALRGHDDSPLIAATSLRTLSMASSGFGGVADWTRLRPRTAATPAPANRTTA